MIFFNSRIFLAITASLYALQAPAQIRSYQYGARYLHFPPAYIILRQPGNLINELCSPQYNTSTWDSTRRRYIGQPTEQLQYPAMAKAGYTVMDVVKLDDTYYSHNQNQDDLQQLLETLDNVAPGNKRPQHTLYQYDAQGRLTGSVTERLYPEGEGYSRHETGISYYDSADGSRRMIYTEGEHSSGRGGGTIYCKTLPEFYERHMTATHTININRYGSITDHVTDITEHWDTCACGGPQTSISRIVYDEENKPVSTFDSSSRENGMYATSTTRYRRASLISLLYAAHNSERLAYFNDSMIIRWLNDRQATDFWDVTTETRSYGYYDNQTRQRVRLDSVSTQTEFGYCITDRQRRILAEWSDSRYDNKFRFYLYGAQPAAHSSWLQLQRLPVIEPKSKDACVPINVAPPQGIRVSDNELYYVDSLTQGDYTLYHYLLNGRISNDKFNSSNTPPQPGNGGIYFIADKNGLVRYAWEDRDVYKITYHN